MNKDTKARLLELVERIERRESERGMIAQDIRDDLAVAKSDGFDVKAIRAVIRLRKQDRHEREAADLVLGTYMHALGMLSDLPLGQAAIARDFGGGGLLAEAMVN